MNLRFVEAFYWVASLKSVTRAAEKLFLTQSAMSSRIAALEEELGVLLLDRRDKQFRLTIAGICFFTYAQRLLELQREVKAEMGSGAPLAVSMRIGAIESVLHSWMIPWIEKLRADHPALEDVRRGQIARRAQLEDEGQDVGADPVRRLREAHGLLLTGGSRASPAPGPKNPGRGEPSNRLVTRRIR